MVNDEIKEKKKGKIQNRKRDKILQVWLSEDEYETFLNKCKYHNISMSYFVRKMITDGEIKYNNAYAINEIVETLTNIENHVNAISQKVNDRGSVTEADNESLKMQYENLFNMFLDKVMGVN